MTGDDGDETRDMSVDSTGDEAQAYLHAYLHGKESWTAQPAGPFSLKPWDDLSPAARDAWMRYIAGSGKRVPCISCGGVSLWLRTDVRDSAGQTINICPKCAPPR